MSVSQVPPITVNDSSADIAAASPPSLQPAPLASAARRALRKIAGLEWPLAIVVALIAACGPAALYPGDTPWMNDEPALIYYASEFNRVGDWCDTGLGGSFNVRYGPLPARIYQVLLGITHNDIVELVQIRALMFSAVLALALLWLARSLGWSPWLVPAVVLAPYVWIESRIIWDATFLIPISVIGIAAYAAFLKSRNGWALTLAALAILTLPFIHPQTVPLCLAVMAHVLCRHARALWANKVKLIAVLASIVAMNYAYVWETIGWLMVGPSHHYIGAHQSKISAWEALLTPFMQGRIFSGDDFIDGYLNLKGRLAFDTAKWVSGALVPVIWVGLGVVGCNALRGALHRLGRRARRPAARLPLGEHAHAASGTSIALLADERVDRSLAARRTIQLIALTAFALNMGLYALLSVPPWQSYFMGPFVLGMIFAWTGLDALAKAKVVWIAVPVYALAAFIVLFQHVHGWPTAGIAAGVTGWTPVFLHPTIAALIAIWCIVSLFTRLRASTAILASFAIAAGTITIASLVKVHRDGWERDCSTVPLQMSPPLGEQVALAKELAEYSDLRAMTDVTTYLRYPRSLRVLRLLVPPLANHPRRQSGHLLIRYLPGTATKIELVEMHSPGDLPPGAGPLALAGPLPGSMHAADITATIRWAISDSAPASFVPPCRQMTLDSAFVDETDLEIHLVFKTPADVPAGLIAMADDPQCPASYMLQAGTDGHTAVLILAGYHGAGACEAHVIMGDRAGVTAAWKGHASGHHD